MKNKALKRLQEIKPKRQNDSFRFDTSQENKENLNENTNTIQVDNHNFPKKLNSFRRTSLSSKDGQCWE